MNINPITNDTDDLYAIWYPYVGKRIIDKNSMIKMLEETIDKIKKGTVWNLGEGFAFRCIQVIDNNEPLVPTRNDDEWYERLNYKD